MPPRIAFFLVLPVETRPSSRNFSRPSGFYRNGKVFALEDALMKHRIYSVGWSPLLAASVLICGLLFAGCDDRITVTRDPDIPMVKGAPGPGSPSRHPKTRTVVRSSRET